MKTLRENISRIKAGNWTNKETTYKCSFLKRYFRFVTTLEELEQCNIAVAGKHLRTWEQFGQYQQYRIGDTVYRCYGQIHNIEENRLET